MARKSAETSLYILKKVAPIFNKHGYMGTSMKAITDAVGLTKGAIYGNFKDKEELAIEAFNYNVRLIMGQVSARIKAETSPLNQLFAITDFYRNYLDFTDSNGGCPILNIGVDANNQNERLLARVKYVIRKLEQSMANIILKGIEQGEMKAGVNAEQYSKRLFAMIQGGIFMTLTLGDKSYVVDMMNHIDKMIKLELKYS
ncbi:MULTISPECIES: TetR/AcrR family transcriptional regulator [unclassified Aureispira]|uniref:TetR/AcrR family transcriptional regulator n=1 Tax=unclassified Aureispira TaxID=2649989 RepID=UPI000696A263|nr:MULTISPECIES: TetR/AcrR family transcriptional regulator [unclassified Aureispira]WMX14166.1 TetR/AcrR family transcriptional regulator [Aureispira sp. CCB-E]